MDLVSATYDYLNRDILGSIEGKLSGKKIVKALKLNFSPTKKKVKKVKENCEREGMIDYLFLEGQNLSPL